jgi:pyridoxal 5'-phosphate synthase pdxT subunit
MKIGVLGLQGAVSEHVKALEKCGVETLIIKSKEQLDEIDGLVLPGGESTTMRRLIDRYHFLDALKEFSKSGKPMFGTCAGLILLAKEINGYDRGHLELLDVKVERNAFGRQVNSFEAEIDIKGIAENFNAVFIRAPYIMEVGPNVEVLAEYEGKIVAVQENHFLACAFHPELTDDTRFVEHFIQMVKTASKELASC